MSTSGYAQQQTVNFIKIENNLVYILVRGVEKGLLTDSSQLEKVKESNFFNGEKLVLMYSSKTDWELKKYQFPDSTVDRYLRKD